LTSLAAFAVILQRKISVQAVCGIPPTARQRENFGGRA
jgi:hypothetical protein